jgi:hypothetical protein
LWSNQYWYHFPSTSAGLYLLANSMFLKSIFCYNGRKINKLIALSGKSNEKNYIPLLYK